MRLNKAVDPAEQIGPDLSRTAQLRVELFPNGGPHGFQGGIHQGQLAPKIVQLDIGHALGRAGAIVNAVGQGLIIRVSGVQNRQQAVIAPLSGQSHSIVYPLRLGHLVKADAQFIDSIGEFLHRTVGFDGGEFILPEGRARQGNALQQSVESVLQRGTGDGALDAGVGHQAHAYSHVLNAVPQCAGDAGGLLEGLAHDADAGVGVGGRRRQHVRKVGGVGGGEAKGSQIVGDNVGHLRQILPGGCGQVDDAVHAVQHLLGLPARHTHKSHGVCGLLSGVLRVRAQLLCRCGQLGHFLSRGAGEGLHVAHGRLKIRRNRDALRIGFIDFVESGGDSGGSYRLLRGCKGVLY